MEKEEEDGRTYKWEYIPQHSWETVQENEHGHLDPISPNLEYERDRKRAKKSREERVTSSIRRGLIRYMVVAVDTSLSACENDFRPSRLHAAKFALTQFISDFYDQNPISQLAIAVTRDRTAEKISELSGSRKGHLKPLEDLSRCEGIASLQNTLLRAISILRYAPAYGHKELLIVYSSLGTCDPNDIQNTINDCRQYNLRVSIICLAAEVYICKKISKETGGSFAVAVDESHLKTVLSEHAIPPPDLQNRIQADSDFIYMGFPRKFFDNTASYAFEGRTVKLNLNSYVCPRCIAKTTDIPAKCNICSLQLNSSSHIARSHHHLFPIPNFDEALIENIIAAYQCSGCAEMVAPATLKLDCPKCKQVYCVGCDIFIHDSMRNCPGCPSWT